MAKWVRHISGQGEKYEVITRRNDYSHYWVVHNQDRNTELKLPCEAYVECEPPERWEDVDCHVPTPAFLVLDAGAYVVVPNCDYQFVRVSDNTFKIQKKVLDNSEKP